MLPQGMAGIALVLGVALLVVRPAGPGPLLFAGQAIAVSIAVGARAGLPVAVLNAAASGVLIPLFLYRQPSPAMRGASWGLTATLAAAGALGVLAMTGGPIGLSLGVLLLALLLVASRPDPVLQAIGLCSMQQAALLACAGVPTPPLFSAALAVPVLPALALASLSLRNATGEWRW
jgi:Na+/H+ antiporter NhaA